MHLPENTYNIPLWVVAVTISILDYFNYPGIISSFNVNSRPVDLILEIIAKSMPVIATFFMYVINREKINKYFKEVFKRKKK